MLLLTGRTVPVGAIVVSLAVPLPVIAATVAQAPDHTAPAVAATLLAGSAFGFTADDAAAPTLASSPATIATRRLHRGLLIGVLVAVAWLATLALATRAGDIGLGGTELLAELTAPAAVALAVACRSQSDRPISVGREAAVAGALSVLVVSALAYRYAWLPMLGGGEHHARWWLVAAAGFAVAAWSSRDPAA